jgi:hypothetical protein
MRLIDADSLRYEISKLKYPEARINMILAEYVNKATEIDAVPVVRCKECEYYNITCCSEGLGWCERMDRGVHDDFYCSYGERKESEGST